MFISFKNLTSAFTLDQSSINNWASNLFAISKSAILQISQTPGPSLGTCCTLLDGAEPPQPSPKQTGPANHWGPRFSDLCSHAQHLPAARGADRHEYCTIEVLYSIWAFSSTCSLNFLDLLNAADSTKTSRWKGNLLYTKQTMQRDPRRRGRRKLFQLLFTSCYFPNYNKTNANFGKSLKQSLGLD